MIRFSFITLCLFITSFLFAGTPEKVHSIVKQDKSHSFYVKQAELWWHEIEKDNKNEEAWFNYYKACRYAKMTFHNCDSPECEKQDNWLQESKYLKEQEDIWELIEGAIPNTYTYYMFYKDGYPGDMTRLDVLLKAYELQPDNPITYDELVVNYETIGNAEKRKEFNKIWFESNDMSPGILNYNYNVLVSVEKNGVVLTFGDNDTFPAWMLQDALNIRHDVKILNVPLLTSKEYRDRIFSELNIPLLVFNHDENSKFGYQETVVKHIMENIPEDINLYIGTPNWKRFQFNEENLYIIGLVMQYSEQNIDNIAILKRNIEQKYALDYLHTRFNYDITQSIVNRTNVNYLPGFIKLFTHYKLSNENSNAKAIKELGLQVAKMGGSEWSKRADEIFK